MKKDLSYMAFAILTVFSLAIVSCGDDDDDVIDGGNRIVLGTWKCDLTHIAAISYVTPCFSGGDFFGGGFRGTTDFTFPMGFGLTSNRL